MESRRIRLITEAYLNGWLDYKKRHSWSSSREEIILYYTEQRIFADLCNLKTLKDAPIAAIAVSLGKPDFINIVDNHYNKYGKYKLPYAFENVKINESGKKDKLSKEDVAELLKGHFDMVNAYQKSQEGKK